MLASKDQRRAAVAAADIANPISGSEASFSCDKFGQVHDRLFDAFLSRDPVAMVDVRAPNGAIKKIQIVVMCGDRCDIGD